MKKLFLLDAYALIYRAYYAFLKIARKNSKGLNTSTIYGFLNTLQDIINREKPTHMAVVFDPPGPTFRHKAYEQYKAQRQETPEDIRMAVPIIKELVNAYRIPVIQVEGFEADDVIGTLAQKAETFGFDVFMMTPDKDYGQLVSEHRFIYKPRFGGNGYDILGINEVNAKFDLDNPKQVIDLLGLMGDASDNIPGCPGIGEKTAIKLLKEFGSIDNLLQCTNQLKGAVKTKIEAGKEMIEFSRFLATIKTDVPVDFDEDYFLIKEPDNEALIKLFTELEFRNHLNKLLGNGVDSNNPTSKTNQQSSLFDDGNFTETSVSNNSNPSFANISTTQHEYVTIKSEEQIEQLIALLSSVKEFCFDTETTSVDSISAELVGISFAIEPHKAFYVPFPDDKKAAQCLAQKFKPVFENKHIRKIGQNIKFDLIVLKNYDITLAGDLFDTMIAHYLINPELRHGMDYMAEVMLQYQTIHIEELIGQKGKNQLSMQQVPIDKITEYACEDADITLQLKNRLEPQIEGDKMKKLFYEIEMPLVNVLAQMEINGVMIDDFALAQSSQTMTNELLKIEHEIKKLAGKELNINSPKQIGELLFENLKIAEKAKKTKTGQYVTDEETLEKMRGKHPVIEKILEYRGLKKLLSTYIDALPALINKKTNKIHTSFNQTVTATGRLSSSNPNLQNIPIRDEKGKEIRKAFIASENCVFLSADYSQVELRIMAHLSKDANMTKAFLLNHDIHAATAANIYKIPIEQVTSEMRRKAKTANFGIIYGISVFGLAERLNIPRSEAKELIDGYFETFPMIKTYMDKCIENAREKGFVETIFGRKRYLPDINSHNANVRGFAERNAINAPIQGSAADIIKIAMVRISKRIAEENLKSQMILQVHDELNFNVPVDEIETLKHLVREEMEQACSLQVPLKVDIGIGNNWLEAH